jgi:sugar/nucleoside kinase (ribokinase family)
MDKEFDVLCLGMMCYDILLRPVDQGILDRDCTLVEEVKFSSGGDAMTEAIISARLGCRTGMISRVGNDLPGKALLDILAANGVDRRYVRVSGEAPTWTSIVLIREDGSRSFVGQKSAATPRLEDLDEGVYGKTKILSYGSLFGIENLDRVAGREIFRKARDAGVLTIADCCNNNRQEPLSVVCEALPSLSYFVPSREEAEYLTGLRDPQGMAEKFLEAGCGQVIIKLGKEGCYVQGGGIKALVPAFPAKVVDTTGAGDNFVGGLIAGLTEGRPLLEAVRFAQGVSSLSVTQMGAVGAVRNREQVREFIDSF